MKQVQIYANFAVDDNLDEELLLEAMESGMRDVLYGMDKEIQIANFDGAVHITQVSLLPNFNDKL